MLIVYENGLGEFFDRSEMNAPLRLGMLNGYDIQSVLYSLYVGQYYKQAQLS